MSTNSNGVDRVGAGGADRWRTDPTVLEVRLGETEVGDMRWRMRAERYQEIARDAIDALRATRRHHAEMMRMWMEEDAARNAIDTLPTCTPPTDGVQP